MVEVQGFDSYLVKMDGTGRVSKRNRAFLRPIRTYTELLAGKKYLYPAAEGASGALVKEQTTPMLRRSTLVERHGQTGSQKRGGDSNVGRQQETEGNTGERCSSGETESNRGRDVCFSDRTAQEVTVLPESNTGRADRSCVQSSETDTSLRDGGVDVVVPEVQDTIRRSDGATQGEDLHPNVRPKRHVKPIDRLVVGDPTKWHFNRAKPRRGSGS